MIYLSSPSGGGVRCLVVVTLAIVVYALVIFFLARAPHDTDDSGGW